MPHLKENNVILRTKARFKRRISHVPNITPILVD